MSGIDHSGAKSVTPGGSVAGHTPGPWEVVDQNGALWVYPVAGSGMGWAGDSYLSLCIGRENGGPANARLIAASPTMYDYVASRADAGDEEALKIVGAIHASR